MNAHAADTLTPDRRVVETLRSLSFPAAENTAGLRRLRLRRLGLGLGLAALTAAAVGAAHLRESAPVPSDSLSGSTSALPRAQASDAAPKSQSVGATGSTIREITSSGFVVAQRMTTVFAKYEGRVRQIEVALGEAVQAGQILATLDDAAAGFAVEQARVATRQAELGLAARRIDLAEARNVLARRELLAAREAGSRQALDEARAAMERAANAVAQAQQSSEGAGLALRVAEERVAELIIRAPIAGIVTRLDARVGDMVLGRMDSIRESQSLLSITDMTSLVIDADVAETSIAALKPGLRGQATLDGFPNRPFDVTLLLLAPTASPEKGAISMRLALDHPPLGIRPKMAARIRIPLDAAGEPGQ